MGEPVEQGGGHLGFVEDGERLRSGRGHQCGRGEAWVGQIVRPHGRHAGLDFLMHRAAWSPFTGSSVISPGCLNCYAAKPEFAAGLTRDIRKGPVWTGELRLGETAVGMSMWVKILPGQPRPPGTPRSSGHVVTWASHVLATIWSRRSLCGVLRESGDHARFDFSAKFSRTKLPQFVRGG